MKPIFDGVIGLVVREDYNVPVLKWDDCTGCPHKTYLHLNRFYEIIKEGTSEQEIGFGQFVTLRSLTLRELTKSSPELAIMVDLKLLINPDWNIEEVEKRLVLYKNHGNNE